MLLILSDDKCKVNVTLIREPRGTTTGGTESGVRLLYHEYHYHECMNIMNVSCIMFIVSQTHASLYQVHATSGKDYLKLFLSWNIFRFDGRPAGPAGLTADRHWSDQPPAGFAKEFYKQTMKCQWFDCFWSFGEGFIYYH